MQLKLPTLVLTNNINSGGINGTGKGTGDGLEHEQYWGLLMGRIEQ